MNEWCGRARLFLFEETIDVTRLSALVAVVIVSVFMILVFVSVLITVFALYA